MDLQIWYNQSIYSLTELILPPPLKVLGLDPKLQKRY